MSHLSVTVRLGHIAVHWRIFSFAIRHLLAGPLLAGHLLATLLLAAIWLLQGRERTDVSLGAGLQTLYQSAVLAAAVWLLQGKVTMQVCGGAAGSQGRVPQSSAQCKLLRGERVGKSALQGARSLAYCAAATRTSAGSVASTCQACCSTGSQLALRRHCVQGPTGAQAEVRLGWLAQGSP